MIIAVDGPAASGKGTIARAIANHFGLPYKDTGLLYRAVALNLLKTGGDPDNEIEAARACELSDFDFADAELKREVVGGIAARISGYPSVRKSLLERQRRFAEREGGAVLDGRDIGTVIAPDADVKLYVTADAHVRAKRRCAELERMGLNVQLQDVLADIHARDERDLRRLSSPLQRAPDAYIIDTSDLSVKEAVDAAIATVSAALRKTDAK
ncbi:MAG TPA: (d)CMP kinase [Allosphingosinicella sp.]|jgi:cytidylate kinase